MTPLDRILSLLLALYMTLVPFSSIPNGPTDASNESSILLDVALFSDVHIKDEGSRQHQNFDNGLKNLSANFTNIDAMAVSGDLTNGGKTESIKLFYQTMMTQTAFSNYICSPGNHDIGHSPLSNSGARKENIDLMNEYLGTEYDNIYFSTDVKGYKFIVIGDDIGEKSNTPVISDEQISWLDNELASVEDPKKPTFIICHWPLTRTNGLERLWPGGGVNGDQSSKIKNVLKKYQNVFFITGHTHGGLTSPFFERIMGYSYVEKIDGVTYVSLPCYGKFNRHGPLGPSIFVRMEVYADKIMFRPYNLRSLKWYPKYDKTVSLITPFNQ